MGTSMHHVVLSQHYWDRIVKSVSVLEQLIIYNLIGGNTLKLK